MTIDALKGQNGITSTTQTSAPKKSNKTEEKSTQLSEALAGKTKNNTLSENGKKELIKYYQDNGYTISMLLFKCFFGFFFRTTILFYISSSQIILSNEASRKMAKKVSWKYHKIMEMHHKTLIRSRKKCY